MAFIDELMDNMRRRGEPLAEVPSPEETPWRTTKQFGNIIPKTAGNIFGGLVGLMGDKSVNQQDLGAANEVFPQFQTGPSAGVKDFILEGLIPSVASYAIPFGAVSKGVRALGSGPVVAEAIGQGVTNLLTSAGYEPEHAEASGALGLISGALQQALPFKKKILPLATVSAIYGAATGQYAEAGFNMLNLLGGPKVKLEPPTGIKEISPFVASPKSEEVSNLDINPKKAGSTAGNYEAVNYPGEFEFVDNLQVRLPDEIQSPNRGFEFQQEQGLLPLEQGQFPKGNDFTEDIDLINRYPDRPDQTVISGNYLSEMSSPFNRNLASENVPSVLTRLDPETQVQPQQQQFNRIESSPFVETPQAHVPKQGTKIEGPVLYDKGTNEVLAKGKIGQEHKDLYLEALGNQADTDPDAIVHGFVDEKGNVLGREDAWKLAEKSGQIKPDVLASAKSMGPEFEALHSDHLLPNKPNVVESILSAKTTQEAHALGQEHIKTPEDAEAVRNAYKEKQVLDRNAPLETDADITAFQQEATKTQFLHEAYQRATGLREDGTSAVADIQKFEPDYQPKLQPLQKEKGEINKELIATLGLTAAAGVVAYTESKGDIGATIGASVLAAGLGAAGISALKKYKAKVGPETSIKGTGVKVSNASVANKMSKLARDTVHTPAGAAVGSRGGLWANAIHKAEGLLGFNALESLRTAKIHANGFIADQVEQLQQVYNKVRSIHPNLSSSFVEAEGRFLRGQLADETLVQTIINDGKSIHPDVWNKLTSVQKKNYPEKWMVLDDPNSTNVKGPGVEIWHVTNSTKGKLMKAQRDALETATSTATDKEYMQFPLKYRETADTLMQMYHDGLPEGSAERAKMVGTLGQYITRSHAIISDPKAYPDEAAINNAMDRLGRLKENAYISQNAVDAPTATKGTKVNWKGGSFYMTPRSAADFQFLHSPESLRAEVRDYIKELKDMAAMKKAGTVPMDSEQFMSSLFTGRKELDEVTQALLGTHQAPAEMMQATLNKLIPAAQVSHFMQDAIKMVDPRTGLKVSLNEIDFNKQIADLKRTVATTGDPTILDQAKFQLQELASYSRLDDNPRFGLGKDTFASRAFKQQLGSFDATPFGFLDNAIGKGLMNFNSLFKTTHLALSPATIARQFVQSPLFMAMGNVRDPNMIKTAYEGYFNRGSGFGQWMNKWGVFSSSAAHGEFNHTLEAIIDGTADKTIWDKVKGGVKKAQKAFAMPDDVVRASIFMNEAKRVSEKLGVSLDSMDDRVGRAAMEFTRRRAMDYSNLPDYVKIGRNIPFVNVFLGYTHEILRITKNMAIDAAKGDVQAGATLAGLSALPFLAQKSAEASLSPVDRAAWQQANNLAQDYSRPRFKIPLSRNKDGSFQYMDITSILPFNDFQMMARSILNKDTESFLQVNPFVGFDKSPALSIIAPQITGKDLHTEREFRGVGDRIANAASQLLPTLTPGIGWEYKKSAPEILGGELGMTNTKTGRTNTGIGALLRNFTGVDLTQVNPGIVTRNRMTEAQHDIADARKYYMDTVKMQGKSPEAQERARQEFIEAVQTIVGDLQSKISLTQSNN